MQHSLDVMQAALRVLTAITDHRKPLPNDVEELVRLYQPKPDGVGVDEWACSAIQAALKHRAAVRDDDDNSGRSGAGE